MKLLAILFCVLSVSFCAKKTERPPDGLISEDLYISLLAESQLILSFEATYSDSLKTDSLYTAMLNAHSVSKEQLENAHRWYRKDVTAQKVRLEKALKRLEELAEKIEVETYNQVQKPTD